MKKIINRRCHDCGEITKHEVERTNHILHLVLSFITGGLWFIVWIIIGITSLDNFPICLKCKYKDYMPAYDGSKTKINIPLGDTLLTIITMGLWLPVWIYKVHRNYKEEKMDILTQLEENRKDKMRKKGIFLSSS